ncbi:MAG: helix-turn-helix domain-containing protein [Solirubrobacteraceae bacterium]
MEGERISRGIAAGESGREIARVLGRAPSTVCREIGVGGGRQRHQTTTQVRCPRKRGKSTRPGRRSGYRSSAYRTSGTAQETAQVTSRCSRLSSVTTGRKT